MRDIKLWLMAGASCLVLCHAMPQPDPAPKPDVNVNVNVDINAPNDDDINVDVDVNIDSIKKIENGGAENGGSNNEGAENEVAALVVPSDREADLPETISPQFTSSISPLNSSQKSTESSLKFPLNSSYEAKEPSFKFPLTSSHQATETSFKFPLNSSQSATVTSPNFPLNSQHSVTLISSNFPHNTYRSATITSSTFPHNSAHLDAVTSASFPTNSYHSALASTSVTLPNSISCTCGEANKANRIVGGRKVERPLKYPWHVGIRSRSLHEIYYCAGSIINTRFILTAAHCFHLSQCTFSVPDDLIIGIADYNQRSFKDDVSVTQYLTAQKIYIHPEYNCQTKDFDFALIELSETLIFNATNKLRPVCLPIDNSNSYEGELGTVTGWGLLNYSNFTHPDILHEVKVPILDTSCGNKYRSQTTDQMLCAEQPGGGKDACIGDSGGPLFVVQNNSYVQVGVVSWGYECAKPGSPGVYSRVSTALDWINEICSKKVWCDTPLTNAIINSNNISSSKNNEVPKSCICGKSNNGNRIVGGKAVDSHLKYPWHVGIKSPSYFSKYYCAGVIINEKFILTAAHCFYFSPCKYEVPDDLVIGIADHDQTSKYDDIVEVTHDITDIEKIIEHPKYNCRTDNYDFTLIKLSIPLIFSETNQLRPVCLPENDFKTYEGVKGTVTGWGILDYDGGSQPNILNEVSIPILEPGCENKYGSEITPQMICTEQPGGGKDACIGDSGGPLVVNENNNYILVGVVSWGYDCAKPGNPGVYSRVTSVLDWLKLECSDAEGCPIEDH